MCDLEIAQVPQVTVIAPQCFCGVTPMIKTLTITSDDLSL